MERAATEVQAIRDLAAGQDPAIAGRVRIALTESFATHVFVPQSLPEQRAPQALDWIALELSSGVIADAAYLGEHASSAPVLLTNSHLLQVEAVRAGHGVALLARAHLALDPELISLDALPAGPALDLWLAAPRAVKPIARVSAVWDFLARKLRALEQS